MRILLPAIFFLLICGNLFAQSGEIRIEVKEKFTLDIISHAKISIYKNDKLLNEAETDSLGHLRVSITENDTVNIYCEELFHKKSVKKNVILKDDKILFIDFILEKL